MAEKDWRGAEAKHRAWPGRLERFHIPTWRGVSCHAFGAVRREKNHDAAEAQRAQAERVVLTLARLARV